MKKIISTILALSLFSALLIPAYATDYTVDGTESASIIVDGVDVTVDVEEEIHRALLGITDLETDMFMVQSDCEGNEVPEGWTIKTYTTTRSIQLPPNEVATFSTTTSTKSKIYATTGVAVLSQEKEDSGSDRYDDECVTAYGTIYWRDNFGLFNDFLGASGGWDVDINPITGKAARLSNRTAQIKWVFDAGHQDYSEVFSFYTNEFDILESDFPCNAAKFTLFTKVKINGTIEFPLTVTTSVLT